MKVLFKEFITVWTRGLVRWLSRKFDSISIDLTPVAKQGTNPAATNTAILAAFGNIDFSTLAKQGTNSEATNTAILAAFNTIDFSSLATKTGQEAAAADLLILKQRIGEATDTASAQTLFGKIAAVIAAVGNIDFSALAHETSVKSGNTTTIGELTNASYGLAALKEAIGEGGGDDYSQRIAQWLGLEESYEAEAKGGERTNNTVIDECKVRFQDAFNGLLPTGFTMPNSVTVDNLTYTGTTNS